MTLRLLAILALAPAAFASPHMANGIKVGEVTQNSAIIWTRLTAVPDMVTTGQNPTEKKVANDAPATPPEHGSVPGAEGLVRVLYWPEEKTARVPKTAWEAAWEEADPTSGHTRQFHLTDLQPGTRYEFEAQAKDGATTKGRFRTAPAPDQAAEVTFTVVTGQDYPRRDDGDRGHKIYPHMLALDPDFFVHTGDIEYFDKPGPFAKNLAVARYKFTRLYALPNQRDFHNQVASYFIKDDHDTLKNDCWPGQTYGDLTWQHGLDLFREQFPMGEKTYRTARWGKHLQVWFVEGRDFRSPNKMPDGPEKTIWGQEQKKWFFDTFAASDATFRVLVSPTPVVGPDRGNKNDNHANKGFTHEGDEIRAFLGDQKNAYVICGDRHWQYHSQDPKTGLQEFSSGPTSNVHAGGFSESNKSDMHQFLRVKGGFLSATAAADGNTLTVRHHDVDGQVANQAALPAAK